MHSLYRTCKVLIKVQLQTFHTSARSIQSDTAVSCAPRMNQFAACKVPVRRGAVPVGSLLCDKEVGALQSL